MNKYFWLLGCRYLAQQCCIGNEKVFSGQFFGGYVVFVCLCFWEDLVFITGGILDD